MGRSYARRLAATVVGATLLIQSGSALVVAATPTDLFISEYVEGSSNNKAIELYNGSGGNVDLAADSYALLIYINGGTTPNTINLTGSVASGSTYVIANPSANAAILAIAGLTTAALNLNGNDAIELRKNGATLDLFGQIGVDPGITGWGGLTTDHSLVRKATVTAGRTVNDAFDPTIEWDAFAIDTFSNLGGHAIDTSGSGGGSDSGTGTVDATVTMASSALCLQLSTSAIDFGSRQFGDADVRGTPDINVTNCAQTSTTLLSRGTDATAPGAAWALVDDASTCADTLGLDAYHVSLHEGVLGSTAAWSLGTSNKVLLEVPAGFFAPFWPFMDTACPGSTGAGQVMAMQMIFVATAP